MSQHFLLLFGLLFIFLSFVLPFFIQKQFINTAQKHAINAKLTDVKGIDLISEMFHEAGVETFEVRIIPGMFTDHYNLHNNTLNLTSSTYHGSTLSNFAIACHEAGHNIQFGKNWFWAKLYKTLLPFNNYLYSLLVFVIIFNLFFSQGTLIFLIIAAAIDGLLFLYSVIVLIVEQNATYRGLRFLKSSEYFDKNELSSCRKVLTVAWLTYFCRSFILIMLIVFLSLIFLFPR